MRKSMLLGIIAAVPIGTGLAAGLAYLMGGSHDHGPDMEESIASATSEITCPVWGTLISEPRMTSLFGLLLSPIIAGAAMSMSSVSVIGNALRLRKIRL